MNVDRSSFLPAVQHFWETRRAATERQRRSAAADKGGRQAVTSGGHLDGFLDVIESVITGAGLANAAEVKRGRRVPVLPGYFRPENEWDLVVLRGGRLGAAIELKAQVGPSFGNNFNNRVFACKRCGLRMDKDVNAARNIGARAFPGVGWDNHPDAMRHYQNAATKTRRPSRGRHGKRTSQNSTPNKCNYGI